MRKTRVLIVDDAVVVRRVVSYVLSSDPELEVAGTAANGCLALAKLGQLHPDVVTLDLEMPQMDGLETLKVLRRDYPRLPVIMLSRFTERGAVATSNAMQLGANDYVTLPDGTANINDSMQRIREQLIPRIKMLARPSQAADGQPTPAAKRAALRGTDGCSLARSSQRIEIVAIGASTGGPDALAAILPKLAGDFPVPIVIVQHMPPEFTMRLAEQLRAKCQIRVSEGATNDLIFPGCAWVAPGGYHMLVNREKQGTKLQMTTSAPENFCRPSVDVLFRSVAETFGAGTLAVVLTGLGQDGMRGCETIRAAGGQVLAQDEASSVVWGMPGAIAKAGIADQVIPLNELANEITRRVMCHRAEINN
jgi:two-component system chemotaxis response regulator CheB